MKIIKIVLRGEEAEAYIFHRQLIAALADRSVTTAAKLHAAVVRVQSITITK